MPAIVYFHKSSSFDSEPVAKTFKLEIRCRTFSKKPGFTQWFPSTWLEGRKPSKVSLPTPKMPIFGTYPSVSFLIPSFRLALTDISAFMSMNFHNFSRITKENRWNLHEHFLVFYYHSKDTHLLPTSLQIFSKSSPPNVNSETPLLYHLSTSSSAPKAVFKNTNGFIVGWYCRPKKYYSVALVACFQLHCTRDQKLLLDPHSLIPSSNLTIRLLISFFVRIRSSISRFTCIASFLCEPNCPSSPSFFSFARSKSHYFMLYFKSPSDLCRCLCHSLKEEASIYSLPWDAALVNLVAALSL